MVLFSSFSMFLTHKIQVAQRSFCIFLKHPPVTTSHPPFPPKTLLQRRSRVACRCRRGRRGDGRRRAAGGRSSADFVVLPMAKLRSLGDQRWTTFSDLHGKNIFAVKFRKIKTFHHLSSIISEFQLFSPCNFSKYTKAWKYTGSGNRTTFFHESGKVHSFFTNWFIKAKTRANFFKLLPKRKVLIEHGNWTRIVVSSGKP